MGTKRRGLLGIVFALALALGLVPGMALTAYAASTSYVDGSGDPQTVDATELASTTNSWTDGSWYVVPEGGLTIGGRIAVNGEVNLILRDGAGLTATAGITTTDATLNIYAQSAGTGALTATGGNGSRATAGGSAGIGGIGIAGSTGDGYSIAGAGGTVNIYGGTVTATGGNGAQYTGGGAGIGGGGLAWKGQGGAGGTVNIYGGTVTATGGNPGDRGGAGAGIGGGGSGYGTGAGASGTLTLGKAVTLYSGTDNTGTVLDGNDSESRSYSGSRPKNMFADIAVGPDKTALSAAIDAAQTLYESIKDNTDYADIAGTLKTAIDTAQGVYDNADADQDAVDGATTTITTAKTTAVVGMINKLPAASDVTTSDKGTIEAVRAAYASLSETEQGKVDANTLKKLTDAEAALKDVIDTAAANTVSETITALKAADEVTTADKTDIEAARAAYEALTDDQKAKVSADTLKKLTDAEDALEVAEVIATITELKDADEVTTADKTDIEAARAAYGALADDQKTAVGADALAKLEACEAALAIAELPAANKVTAGDKAAIEKAREAYDKLSDAQKAAIGDVAKAKLETVEAALAIAELPATDTVTTDNKAAIEAARKAYDALSDAQKSAVGDTAKQKLEACEVAVVGKMIDALPAADQVTIANKDAIEAARAAYDALTPEQQAKVNEDPSVLAYLQTAEAALAIAELPAANKVTAGDKAAIEAARDAYDALTKEQQAKIPADALKKLTDAEDKLLIIETVGGLISDQAKAGEVTDRINNALPAADEITLEDETKVAAARMSYELLTDAQKNLVSEDALKKLEAAEEKISELQEQAALEAVKDSAIERLDVYAEARAKSDATADEKAAFDKAVADGKKAINEAKTQEAVAGALTDAKTIVDAAVAKIESDRADAAAAAAEMAAADKAVDDANTAAGTAKTEAEAAAANEYASDADKTVINNAKETLDAKIKAAEDLPTGATAQQKNDAAKAIEDAVKALNEAVDTANIHSAAAKAEAEAAATAAEQLAAAKTTAIDRLDIYAEARAKSDATADEKAAFDKAVADGKKAINEAKTQEAVAEALTNAKTIVDAAIAKIESDRADAAAAAQELAEADKAVEDAKTAADTAKKAAAEAVANEYATDADKIAVNTAKEALDAKIKAATDLPADATAQQRNDAAKAIEDAVKALNEAVDTANVNSTAAQAQAEAEAKAAEQLAAAKTTAIDRLDIYAEARAKADATSDEKAAFDKAVADGKKAIDDAESQEAVAEALTNAKASVDAAVAKIESDRAAAAAAAAEMAAADQAVADAGKAAEAAKSAADAAAADQYASEADKAAIGTAKETLDAKVKAAAELPGTATAKDKEDAAKAIEDAAKALDEAADKANVNSAAAKAAAEEAAEAAAQLAAAKGNALDRLEDYSEAKALADATDAEKAEYDQAVADGKKAIGDAADKDAVAAALTGAKRTADAAIAKINTDRAAAKSAADQIGALPGDGEVKASDRPAVEAARAAYDALTDDQKAKVPADALAKLAGTESALEVAEAEAAIDALPAAGNVATSDRQAIEAARAAYEALSDDQKAKVSADALKKLEGAEAGLAAAEKEAARTPIDKAKVTLAKKSMTCTGKALKPQVKSVVLNGKKLDAKTDYSVGYANNVNPGKATVTVTGKGDYKGSAKATFAIGLAKAKVSTTVNVKKKALTAKWAKVKGAKSYQVQWRVKGGKWKSKTVKSTNATIKGLKAGKAYDVRVRAVSGKSKGVWSAQKHRWLAKQAGVKATSKKAGTVKVSWKKNAKANAGFKVTVRYSKTGKAVATKTVAAGKTSATIKGLKAGKSVSVKVQPLRKAGGATYSGQTARAQSVVKVAGKAKAVKAQSAEAQSAGSGKLTAAAL